MSIQNGNVPNAHAMNYMYATSIWYVLQRFLCIVLLHAFEEVPFCIDIYHYYNYQNMEVFNIENGCRASFLMVDLNIALFRHRRQNSYEIGTAAMFGSLTNEKRHFLPPDRSETLSLEFENNANNGNDDIDLSLWDNKPNNPPSTSSTQMAFHNKAFNGNDVPSIDVSQFHEPVDSTDHAPVLSKQEETVNDMIDILIHPGPDD